MHCAIMLGRKRHTPFFLAAATLLQVRYNPIHHTRAHARAHTLRWCVAHSKQPCFSTHSYTLRYYWHHAIHHRDAGATVACIVRLFAPGLSFRLLQVQRSRKQTQHKNTPLSRSRSMSQIRYVQAGKKMLLCVAHRSRWHCLQSCMLRWSLDRRSCSAHLRRQAAAQCIKHSIY